MNRLISLIIFFLLFYAGCNSLISTDDSDLTKERTIELDGIEYTACVEKSVFDLNDILKISFTVRNKTAQTKQFNFSNIQQLGFELINVFGKTVVSYPMIVSPALSSFSVLTGETKSLYIQSQFKDWNGKTIDPGTYAIIVFLLDNNSPRLSLKIKVE